MNQRPPSWKKTTIARVVAPSLAEIVQKSLKITRDPMAIHFDGLSPRDIQLIAAIADREIALAKSLKSPVLLDRTICMMDVATIHCNDTPLNLLGFLLGNQNDFMEEFNGIGLNIDRRTGRLLNGHKIKHFAKGN